MNILQIDFEYANIISDRIADQKDIIDAMVSKNNNFGVSGLPAGIFKDTLNEINTMKTTISTISNAVDKIAYAFDNSVEKYYQMENNLEVDEQSDLTIENNTRGIGDKFTWGYKTNGSGFDRVSKKMMEDYLLSRGATRNEGSTYSINIDGNSYTYDIETCSLSINGNKIKCDFYLSKDYKNGQIVSTVTMLGGVGDRTYGPIGSEGDQRHLAKSTSIGDNGLLIVPYTGRDIKISPEGVIGSNEFADKIFNASKATHSVVGFSEGTRVASEVINKYPGSFDNVVFVNGATRYFDNHASFLGKNGNYDGFKNTNIYYIETQGGWGTNSVSQSIKDLVNNGVNPSNITLITNESSILKVINNSNTGINIDNSMPATSSGYKGHENGAWVTLNNSGIINYLTTR